MGLLTPLPQWFDPHGLDQQVVIELLRELGVAEHIAEGKLQGTPPSLQYTCQPLLNGRGKDAEYQPEE